MSLPGECRQRRPLRAVLGQRHPSRSATAPPESGARQPHACGSAARAARPWRAKARTELRLHAMQPPAIGPSPLLRTQPHLPYRRPSNAGHIRFGMGRRSHGARRPSSSVPMAPDAPDEAALITSSKPMTHVRRDGIRRQARQLDIDGRRQHRGERRAMPACPQCYHRSSGWYRLSPVCRGERECPSSC